MLVTLHYGWFVGTGLSQTSGCGRTINLIASFEFFVIVVITFLVVSNFHLGMYR